jgi:DNA-binding SARP family transcriptional activator
MSPLRLRLLGPPEVTTNGRLVRLGHKTVALLALLSLRGPCVRRDLARLLWPDAADPLNSLSAARSALIRSVGPSSLRSDAETIALAPNVPCDVLDFRRAAESGHPHGWSLWRGEFLAGLRLPEWENGLGEEFETWLYDTRDSLRSCRHDLALALARRALRRGEPSSALPYLDLVLAESDEAHEHTTRWYILTVGALGQPDRAARAYALLARDLGRTYGLSPTPDTLGALDAARAGRDACRDLLAAELRRSERLEGDSSNR